MKNVELGELALTLRSDKGRILAWSFPKHGQTLKFLVVCHGTATHLGFGDLEDATLVPLPREIELRYGQELELTPVLLSDVAQTTQQEIAGERVKWLAKRFGQGRQNNRPRVGTP